MVGEIVHGGLGNRADHREVKEDAQDHHHQVEDGEGDRPAGLKSFLFRTSSQDQSFLVL